MNFEQLKLQIHMRDLYDRLGAMDAELMILRAFELELARHERIQALANQQSNRAHCVESSPNL